MSAPPPAPKPLPAPLRHSCAGRNPGDLQRLYAPNHPDGPPSPRPILVIPAPPPSRPRSPPLHSRVPPPSYPRSPPRHTRACLLRHTRAPPRVSRRVLHPSLFTLPFRHSCAGRNPGDLQRLYAPNHPDGPPSPRPILVISASPPPSYPRLHLRHTRAPPRVSRRVLHPSPFPLPFRHSCAGRNPGDHRPPFAPPRRDGLANAVRAAARRWGRDGASRRAWVPACAGMTEGGFCAGVGGRGGAKRLGCCARRDTRGGARV